MGSSERLLSETYLEETGFNPLHRMFSISKSVTALAVGCLEAEGKLSLDDKILKYFPEYAEGAHPWLQALTIRQMLRMESCHLKTTYKHNPSDPWVESFFRLPPDHAPGTFFHYDTSSPHVLAALAERLSGEKLLDYLRRKGLRERGFSDEAYFLEDPQGHPMGGSGLMATSRDMLLLAQLVMQGGGAVFPEAFCREMTAFQTVTATEASIPEESCGYGYQCWRNRRGFTFYGMGGQLAVALPEQDLILITTADLQKSKAEMQTIFDLFFRYIADPLLPAEKAAPEREERPVLSLPQVPDRFAPDWPSFDFSEETEAESLRFVYNKKEESCIRLRKNGRSFEIPFKTGEKREIFMKDTGHRAFVSAGFPGPRQLQITVQVLAEEVGRIDILAGRSQEAVALLMKNNIERFYAPLSGVWTFPLDASEGRK